MINRRSVPALHRACLHLIHHPEQKKPDEILRPEPLKTDMTAFNLLICPSVCPLSGMMTPTLRSPAVRCWTALW
jgi:hypothetical protein